MVDRRVTALRMLRAMTPTLMGCLSSSCSVSGNRKCTHSVMATPRTAIDTNIQRQSPITSSTPCPMLGATAGTSRKITKIRLIIRAILSPPTRSRMMAGGKAMIPAAKKPCSARSTISCVKLVTSAQASEKAM